MEEPKVPARPSLMQRMARILRNEAKQVDAEAISKTLPSPVMPREAIEKKRSRLQRLDEETKE